MHQIVIIGTVPPCPRFKLLTDIVKAKVELMKLEAEVKHVAYSSGEAHEIASKVGLKPGTAKDVAQEIGGVVDALEMPKDVDFSELEFLGSLEPELKHLESLFLEVNIMDRWLRPFENEAVKAGILMTPTLIIDGEIEHSGSVPSLKSIDSWLGELK